MNDTWMKSVAAVAAGFWLAGCGLMVHGTTQRVSVATDPPGASIKVSGEEIGPGEVTLKRNRDYQVVATMPGYETATAPIISNFSYLTVLNWGPVGWVVDLVAGSAYDLEPDVITLTLTPNRTPSPLASRSE